MAGLSAAWELVTGSDGVPPRVVVLEAGPRPGGKVRPPSSAGRTVDLAADAFLARRPEATRAVRRTRADGRAGGARCLRCVVVGTRSAADDARRGEPRRAHPGVAHDPLRHPRPGGTPPRRARPGPAPPGRPGGDRRPVRRRHRRITARPRGRRSPGRPPGGRDPRRRGRRPQRGVDVPAPARCRAAVRQPHPGAARRARGSRVGPPRAPTPRRPPCSGHSTVATPDCPPSWPPRWRPGASSPTPGWPSSPWSDYPAGTPVRRGA